MDIPGYESLRSALEMAYAQSALGKGKERHANGKPFDRQPIMEIARMVGLAGQTYQICKKAQEATTMDYNGQHERAIAELCGVMVYAAAGITLLNEKIIQDKHAQSRPPFVDKSKWDATDLEKWDATDVVEKAAQEAIKELEKM